MVSLNVNGMNNPVKRAKVLAKFRKEGTVVIFLQETHLSSQEHDKLKRFGYDNTFYSSFKQTNRRGVATLIKNSVKFDLTKEISDKEGRYVMVKGKMEGQMVTLLNIYAPPDSDRKFFKTIFDIIAEESEGTLICAGDFNVTLDHKLDTTSTNRSRARISRYVNLQLSELGIVDVWRDMHLLDRDYTHYSHRYSTYSRIDYFFMTTGDRHRVEDCRIGVTDLSDHSAIYLTVDLNSRRRKTEWRMNVGLLNNKDLVEGIRRDITRYREENDNGEVDPTILWDALKSVIRGKLIAQTSLLKRTRLELYQNLIGQLKKLEKHHQELKTIETLKRVKEVRGKIDQILLTEVEKKARFVKQSYYEGGPKASKLLARRIKMQQKLNTVHKIRDPTTDELVREPEDIERVFVDYYKALYTQPTAAEPDRMKDFLEGLELPSIGRIRNDLLTSAITEEELEEAIGRMKNGKTAGSDGFPSEFYKVFRQELNPILMASLRYTMKEGKIPPSWKEANITTILKEGKDKDLCSSFRPISILNVDYKIYTSILSKRFGTFMPDVVDEGQTGFIRGRQAQDNIRKAIHIVDETQRSGESAVLVSLDAEKAFDCVNWTYLFIVLEKLGFNDSSVKCIKALYQEPTARVRVNGSLSDRFILGRSTRQGCCLSPTLFAIFMEPLAQAIRQHQDIRGVEIRGTEHKLGLFADDLLVYITQPDVSFPALMGLLQEYGYYSGYKINVTKTQILTLNYSPPKRLKESFKIIWDSDEMKYLGVYIQKE